MHGVGGAWARSVLLAASASFALGCGGSDDPPAEQTPDCGTVSNPDEFVIANVEPAAGASAPNANIIHRFKIIGDLFATTLSMALPAAHTAGLPIPNPTMWQPALESDGVMYTSTATSWTTAPGHVELQFAGAYQDPDGCFWAFPSPLFSYEITEP